MSTVTIERAAGLVLSANDRGHWAKRHRWTKEIRDTAFWFARQAKLGPYEAITVTAVIHPPDNRRRDAHNLLPTVKAAVDGLVDAGVIEDDNDDHLHSLTLTRGEMRKRGIWVIDLQVSEAVGP